jgi:4-amino-4-deoxy-L-arabinose transferase-like glycosyltransferase
MRYTSVFPHTWGYTLALSAIYRVFGASPAAAAGFNVLLCAVIAWLIYDIGRRLFDRETGFRAGLLWACLPSSILFVNITGSEMLHLALFLLAADSGLMICGGAGLAKRLLWSGLAGAAAGLSTLVRPLGPVLLIALALTVLLAFAAPLKHKLAYFAVLGAAYMLVTGLFYGLYLTPLLRKSPDIGSPDELGNIIVRDYADTRPATGNAGWNIFVGLNPDTSGAWNANDQMILNHYYYDESLSASEVHARMALLAGDRAAAVVQSGELVPLLIRKFVSIWARDDWVADWIGSRPAPSVLPADAWRPVLRWLCNAFYLALLLCCLPALFRMRKLQAHPVLLVVLLLLGLWALHLLVENNARYHYPINAFLCLIAAKKP